MVESKADKFLDMVRRSRLVDREQLVRAQADLKGHAGDAGVVDEKRLADKLVDDGLLTPWQRENLLQGRYKGFFVKKYKLLDLLGAGGMSHVYLAEHTLMRRRVAIKVLPKSRVKDSSYLGRFHREARAAAALDHRNIVRAYDVDNDGDVHFFVMEYVEGCDLQTMVKRDGPLDYVRAADYVRQAAEGLDHAHRAGLIHRDVKPANLLVDRQNVVKVLDLGLAKFAEEGCASLTVAYDENILGTADYLSPEQAINSHGVDARADIYSLGCSFYYILTGQPPFAEGTLPQRLLMHQKVPPPDIRLKRPDAPEDLLEICLRMMAKKPVARFQSAREVADALGGWLQALGHLVDTSVGGSSSSTRLKIPSSATGPVQAVEPAPSGGSSSRALARAAALERAAQGSPAVSDEAAAPAGSKSRIGLGTARPSDSGSGRSVPAADSRAGSGAPGSGAGSGISTGSSTAGNPAGSASSNLSAQSPLRKARRLESIDPMAEIAAMASQLAPGASGAFKAVSDEQLAAYQTRRHKLPPWVWWALAGAGLLAVALLALALVLGL